MRKALAATALTLLVAGCSSSPTPASRADQIGAWSRDGGQDHLQSILTDNQTISADTGNLTAFATDCENLRHDIQAARAYKPVPDTQAQQHWTAALTDEATSAEACISAASSGNLKGWEQASTSSTAAQTELKAMMDRVAAINSGGQ